MQLSKTKIEERRVYLAQLYADRDTSKADEERLAAELRACKAKLVKLDRAVTIVAREVATGEQATEQLELPSDAEVEAAAAAKAAAELAEQSRDLRAEVEAALSEDKRRTAHVIALKLKAPEGQVVDVLEALVDAGPAKKIGGRHYVAATPAGKKGRGQ